MKRRSFLKKSALAAAGLGLLNAGFPAPGIAKIKGVNNKLNIAQVGVSGMQGTFHLDGTSTENRFALCDVDSALLDAVCKENPNAKRFCDWRDMLDQVGDQIDGILITTPDHTHATIACAAMRRGIHCYCEKPLGHDIREIRTMARVAKENNVVTQMGIQIHSGDNYRRVVELIQSGAIGVVKDVQVWVATTWGGNPATNDDVPIPATLNWDLWIGPAPMRKFQPCYLGGNWRSFWDFGSGGMGDMACHYMDLVFWALNLKYPRTIEAIGMKPADADYAPRDLSVRYEFDPIEGTDPLTVTWYDGVRRPACLAGMGLDHQKVGIIFFGTEGAIYANYGEHALLPANKFEGFVRPEPTIPSSIGHHAEWFKAIKEGGTPSCSFDYGAPLAETALLGPLAYRCGQKIVYDAENMAVTNCPKAAELIARPYRDGWTL